MHILGQAHEHSEKGVFKRTLSGKQLIADKIEWDPADLARLP
jgi:hypothetical protein